MEMHNWLSVYDGREVFVKPMQKLQTQCPTKFDQTVSKYAKNNETSA